MRALKHARDNAIEGNSSKKGQYKSKKDTIHLLRPDMEQELTIYKEPYVRAPCRHGLNRFEALDYVH
jgi:hypothetical protein